MHLHHLQDSTSVHSSWKPQAVRTPIPGCLGMVMSMGRRDLASPVSMRQRRWGQDFPAGAVLSVPILPPMVGLDASLGLWGECGPSTQGTD